MSELRYVNGSTTALAVPGTKTLFAIGANTVRTMAGNETLDKGIDVFLEIEVQGALQVKKKVPDAVFIFLTPPDLEELQDRLVGRGTDSAEVIAQRIEKAKEEIALMREYDYAIVNDHVPLAAERVKRVIEAEHFRVDRVIGHYQDMLPKSPTIR